MGRRSITVRDIALTPPNTPLRTDFAVAVMDYPELFHPWDMGIVANFRSFWREMRRSDGQLTVWRLSVSPEAAKHIMRDGWSKRGRSTGFQGTALFDNECYSCC